MKGSPEPQPAKATLSIQVTANCLTGGVGFRRDQVMAQQVIPGRVHVSGLHLLGGGTTQSMISLPKMVDV